MDELIDCMVTAGILHVIGDIIADETDPLVLVCFFVIYLFNALPRSFLSFLYVSLYPCFPIVV